MAYFVHHAHTSLAKLAKYLVFARNDYCHRRSCKSPPLSSPRLFRTIGSSSLVGESTTFAAFLLYRLFRHTTTHSDPSAKPYLGDCTSFRVSRKTAWNIS